MRVMTRKLLAVMLNQEHITAVINGKKMHLSSLPVCDVIPQVLHRLYYRSNGAATETYALALIRDSIISSYSSWLYTTVLWREHRLADLWR